MFYFILEICLYMYKSFLWVDVYNCNYFRFGCFLFVYFLFEIFKCKFCRINVY